ncbi:MAG: hypothetical protein IKP54_06890 [Bacteroidales bacterium]|nr:hypothetical protein [Bacteroidales bacterium]
MQKIKPTVSAAAHARSPQPSASPTHAAPSPDDTLCFFCDYPFTQAIQGACLSYRGRTACWLGLPTNT